MIKLTKITNALTKVTGRTGLKVSKYSPEILVVTGVVGIITSTVLACRGTLKLTAILDEAGNTLDRIQNANETVSLEKYSKADAKKDAMITYFQTGAKVLKVYAPAITVGFISIGCILSSYKILHKRNIALMAAYQGIQGAFAKYRERLIEDVGVDKDKEYFYGVKKVETTETIIDAKGKGKEVKKIIDVVDGQSQYAQLFDETSKNWSKTHEYNLMHLKCQQNFANDMLTSRGHLFLNEVYDMIGLPRTTAGAITGWVKGNGDSFIDFNIFDSAVCLKPNVMNEYDRSILLDFNVDGVVYDKI